MSPARNLYSATAQPNARPPPIMLPLCLKAKITSQKVDQNLIEVSSDSDSDVEIVSVHGAFPVLPKRKFISNEAPAKQSEPAGRTPKAFKLRSVRELDISHPDPPLPLYSLKAFKKGTNGTLVSNHSNAVPQYMPVSIPSNPAKNKAKERQLKINEPFMPPSTSRSILPQSSSTTPCVYGMVKTNLPSEMLMDIVEAEETPSVEKEKAKAKKNSEVVGSNLLTYDYQTYSPHPTMVYTRSEEQANDLAVTLRGPIGFDMEWRPVFSKNTPQRRTAVVQLSDKNKILIVQISDMTRFPQEIIRLIESPEVLKLGANILNDARKLHDDFGIRARGLVELGVFASLADPQFTNKFPGRKTRPIVGLAKVVKAYCAKRLEKGKERTMNWELAPLKPRMLTYAANDAHCALTVYNELLLLQEKASVELTVEDYAVSLRPPFYTAPPAAEPTQTDIPLVTDSLTTTSTATTAPQLLNSADTNTNKVCTSANSASHTVGGYMRPQHFRAYSYWHKAGYSLEQMCQTLRSVQEPLKPGTVITYVVGALQTDPRLPFETERLRELLLMDITSWPRHRDWFLETEASRIQSSTAS